MQEGTQGDNNCNDAAMIAYAVTERVLLRPGRPGEFALTLTVFFTLIFCFMEICLMFYSFDLISELAREGSRYAMMRSSTCQYPSGNSCASTAAQVNSYVSSYGLPNMAGGTITPATAYSGSSNVVGNNVTVTVNYVLPISMPFVPTKSITLSSALTMPIIQ